MVAPRNPQAHPVQLSLLDDEPSCARPAASPQDQPVNAVAPAWGLPAGAKAIGPIPAAAPPPAAPTATPARPAAGPAPAVGVCAPQPPWQHPETNRRAVLAGQTVGYVLRRGSRRTIGLTVHPQGLTVSAPRWTTLAAVDDALQAKASWVVQKLRLAGDRHQAQQAARLDWADGMVLPWLGGGLTVRLGAAIAQKGQPLVSRSDDTLWVGLPGTATPAQLRDAVQAWMMQAAHHHFTQRLTHFAPLLGVRWLHLRLSAAATRWGSAKADGSIRLHWRLMQFAPEVVDYVVAHELSHLRHMNHGPQFWHTVASVVPDYAALRARLKGEPLPPW